MKMTSPVKLILCFVSTLFLCVGSIHAQYWMQKGGSASVDEAFDVSTDGSGNTYAVGYFTGSATFGGTTLNSSGSSDIFIAKINSSGNYDWAVKAGGSGSDRGLAIETDGSGNSYITGFFNGTATFGGQTVTTSGAQDVFIAKYNSSGTLDWVEKAGGSGADIGNGISIDNSGNPVITGEFSGTSTFGGTTLTSLGNSVDVFISKLTPGGTFTWTEQGSGAFTDRGIDVACDGAGNIYATGQFSDTITFDNTHNNAMFNVIYVIKYNSAGQEQWFRIIGAASSNIANSITSDGSGNVYLTGDYTGITLTFFGNTNFILNGNYTNRIFVAKYNSSGALTWAQSDGSDGDLSSRSIEIDGLGNAYIAGHFDCRLDEYADSYGDGTFNSVGFSDIFVAKYSTSGTWLDSRQLGGKEDDFGHGVAVTNNGRIHLAGSFKEDLFVPVSSNFLSGNLSNWTQYLCSGNAPYCSDSDYDDFYGLDATGNSDVIIANCFDLGREPYDYYLRSGGGCNRDVVDVCIEPGCPSVVTGCVGLSLDAFPNTCDDIGPDYTYLWSTGWNLQNGATITSSGTYYVTQTSDDGCFVSVDSIEVIIMTPPPLPTISDDVVINTNTSFPQKIELCQPDSVLLTGGNFGSNTILWTGPGLGLGVSTPSIMVTVSGFYLFTVTDNNGCTNSVQVEVEIYPPLPTWDLRIRVMDTVEICDGETFEVMLFDTISNPTAQSVCLDTNSFNINTVFTVTPSVPVFEVCDTYGFLTVSTSGTYTIEARMIRTTPCDTDTIYANKTIFVTVLPAPVVPPFNIIITGGPEYCPGDSATLIATGSPGTYNWTGPNVNGLTTDSVYAYADGNYTVSSTVSDTNQFGCTDSYTDFTTIIISEKPQPIITSSSLLICPNGSVTLSVPQGQGNSYQWEGPNGTIPGDTHAIEATDPGFYFVVVNDADSCDLVSNTVELLQYTTPQLVVNGNPILCEGDSVPISVITNMGSVIEWQAPLSGDTTTQMIYTPGTYTVKITSCNIESFASIDVLPSYVEAGIIVSGPLCEDSSVVLYGTPGMDTYAWTPGNQTTDSIVVTTPGTYVLTTSDTNGCEKDSDPFVVELVVVPANISLDGYTTFCAGDSIVLLGNDSVDRYLWNPGGETTQNIITYDPGTYTLTTWDTNGCSGLSEPITVMLADTIATVEVEGDLYFCEEDSAVLKGIGGKGIEHFIWLPGNDTAKTISVFQSGTYTLYTIDTFGCEAVAPPIDIIVEPNLLTAPITSDTTICGGIPVTLGASTTLGSLNWYDEEGGVPIEIGGIFTTPVLRETTTYYLVSELAVCQSDTTPVTVTVLNCDSIFVPNVFTPNRDGINDIWYPQINRETCFNCKIYNRWGQLLHEFYRKDEGWDGTLTDTGKPAKDGTYYYIIEYCKFNGEGGVETGYISLFRGSPVE